MKQRLLLLSVVLFLPLSGLQAQTPVVAPDWSAVTKIAPAYFGPNAFPVPEMTDGRPVRDARAVLTR